MNEKKKIIFIIIKKLYIKKKFYKKFYLNYKKN